MTLTRADAEIILVKRTGALLTEADLDGTTNDGSNADLNDPIGWAVRRCGGTVSDFVAISDTDVATVGSTDYDKFLDLVEYRTLQSISGNLAVVDIKSGPFDEKLSQLVKQVEERLKRKAEQLKADYGFNVSFTGLGFRETDDTGDTIEPIFQRKQFGNEIIDWDVA